MSVLQKSTPRGRAAREGFAAARGWWLGWLHNFVEGSLGKIGRF